MTGAPDDEIEARVAQRLAQRLIRALRERGATLELRTAIDGVHRRGEL